jgi:glycosyltransferase involved in cell wall biosynthesis
MIDAELRIAFVSVADPRDRRSWSGSTFFMAQALEKHVGRVDYLGPLSIPGQQVKSKLAQLIRKMTGRRYYPDRTLRAAMDISKQIAKKLSAAAYDLIFAPAASVEIAFLETDLPIIYVSDATFALMREVYPIFSSLTPKAIETENFFEKTALKKSRLILYPSEWAARSAIRDYGAEKARVKVIPFGANLDYVPAYEAVTGKEIGRVVKMLFLAKEWERKGGAIAFETLKALVDMGVEAQLTVCGVVPPTEFRHPGMKVIPYLDKNVSADRERFEQTLVESHLLLLPTRTECYGVVFCEANAYGMPVFATRVGGIPTIVKEGENGYLLEAKAGGKDFADLITRTVLDPAGYAALNLGARNRFERILNWDTWGKAVRRWAGGIVG